MRDHLQGVSSQLSWIVEMFFLQILVMASFSLSVSRLPLSSDVFLSLCE